jgi:lipopolysaccharide biosynthesis glycosyltransferase
MELDGSWNWQPWVARVLQNGRSEPFAPSIVHFSGYLKPWTYPGRGQYHELYYHFLDQTAWAGWRPEPGWKGELMSRYETSRLRSRVYPAEQWALKAARSFTLRYHP